MLIETLCPVALLGAEPMEPSGLSLDVLKGLEVARNPSARVDLLVNDDFITEFRVDSGSTVSYVSLRELEEEGLQELIVPLEHQLAVGVIRLEVKSPDGVLISDDFWFHVLPKVEVNMLGMDFLSSTRGVLVLDRERPLLWLNQRPRNTDDKFRIYADVEVNGSPVNAFVDTGFSKLFACSLEQAEALELQVERMETPRVVLTPNGLV